MGRKTSTVPTMVYSFGCYEPKDEADLKLVNDQFFLANRFRNDLVAIELDRRSSYLELESTYADIASINEQFDEVLEEKESVYNQIAEANKESGKKGGTPELRKEAKRLRGLVKELRAKKKAARDALKKNDDFVRKNEALSQSAWDERKRLSHDSELFWPSQNKVKEAARQSASSGGRSRPRFKRYDGEGVIWMQIQKTRPLKGRDLFGDDTRIRLSHLDEKKRRASCKIRVSSTKSRKPIFAEFEVVLHREIPPDAEVKWVAVARRRVASHSHYFLLVVVEHDAREDRDFTSKSVGVDIGWRIIPDGLRALAIYDSDENWETVDLPLSMVSQFDKSRDLRSIRDKNFDEIREDLKEWMGDSDFPDWLRERTKAIHLWRSQAKLSKLVWHWRNNRFSGDEKIFRSLEDWRQQNKHLYEWEANAKRKAIAARNHAYRIAAKRIALNYDLIAVEKLNLTAMGRRTFKDSTRKELARKARRNRGVASPGNFFRFLSEAAFKYGSKIVKVPPRGTSSTCHACGAKGKWDDSVALERTCMACLTVSDRDMNGAKNILKRGLVISACERSGDESSPGAARIIEDVPENRIDTKNGKFRSNACPLALLTEQELLDARRPPQVP